MAHGGSMRRRGRLETLTLDACEVGIRRRWEEVWTRSSALVVVRGGVAAPSCVVLDSWAPSSVKTQNPPSLSRLRAAFGGGNNRNFEVTVTVDKTRCKFVILSVMIVQLFSHDCYCIVLWLYCAASSCPSLGSCTHLSNPIFFMSTVLYFVQRIQL